MFINIQKVSKMLGMPIPSLRLGLSGLKEYRTSGGHRRYDLNEVLRLSKSVAKMKERPCPECGWPLENCPWDKEDESWCMCCYEINRILEKDD
jgi:hypothetical protein